MQISSDFLDLLGDSARRAALAPGLSPSSYDNKAAAGFDPVTQADRAVERALREAIEARFPDDAICGEEYGWDRQGARRIWSLDPIDGTRAFLCGLPSWAVLVGVIEDGAHVAGMIDLPALGERLIAVGGQTRRNGDEAATSGCSMLSSARLSTTDPDLFDLADGAAFHRAREQALMTRYGLDALAYARVATGGIDLVIESGLKRHDLDALVAIVRGAGGAIGDWRGGEDWDAGRLVAAASQKLYDQTVVLLTA